MITGVDFAKILGGQKVVKSDKCMGDSQLLGHVPGLPPKSTPMWKAVFAVMNYEEIKVRQIWL